MPTTPSDHVSNNGLTVAAYAGDGDVLLAFNLDDALLKQNDLAGFSIQFTPPNGQPSYLSNRLNYVQPVTAGTPAQQHPWTSSQDAPFQKFHWVHFPTDVVPGQYSYTVTARYCQGTKLVDGPSAAVTVELLPAQKGNFEVGLTRGYVSSQAYATKFKNADLRPKQKTLDYDTKPYQPQYEWLGFHARKLVFDVLTECVNDPSITVDMFAYDFDEPDILKMCEALGSRLRIFLDNAPLHTGPALEVQVHERLLKSAGPNNVKQGHFKRFAHDKIIIQKKDGKAVKVLTGSANFSVRGLYVQANNILVFNDPKIADQYDQVFESVFNDMSGYVKTPLASQWFAFPNEGGGIPNFKVSFAPHPSPPLSMATVAEALQNAKSSVMFAVMQLSGSGVVIDTLQKLHLSGKVFSYGMTQSDAGFTLYKPGQPGQLVPFSALTKPMPPFDQEITGGQGQVIHDKFIVIDFNGDNPVVFTGSSNLADGGETQNGDNLLAIYDREVARVFAAEAVRLVDHFYFRAAVSKATDVKPLQLTACGGTPPWWQRDYDPQNMRNVQRLLFSEGPGAVTTIPAGISDSSGGAPAKAPAKKATGGAKAPAKKAPAKASAPATAPAATPTPATAKKAVASKKAAVKKPAKAKPAKKAAAPAKKKAAKKSAPRKTATKKKVAAKKTSRTAAKAKPKKTAAKARPAKKAAPKKSAAKKSAGKRR